MKRPPRRRQPANRAYLELQARLTEAEETLQAIGRGAVDALVVNDHQGEQVFTLKGADHAYRVMVEKMQEGAVTLSRDGMILYCNRRFADLLRLPLEKLMGNKIWPYVTSAHRQAFRHLLRSCGDSHGPFEIEMKPPRGAAISCLISAAPVEMDETRAICVIITDLTEKKHNEEKFRLMIDNARDYSFYMIDARGIVTTWTAAAERMYGYSEREMIGNSFTILRNGDAEAIRMAYRSLETAARTGSCDEEGWRVTKDGRKFKVNVLTTALRNKDGTLRGFSRLSKDITEQHRLEQLVLEASAREQRRIGMDLHDNLGQQLTGISYLLEATVHGLPPSETLTTDLKRIQQLLLRALDHTRATAHGLCPVELKGHNFRSVLREFARNTEKIYEIRCRVSIRSLQLNGASSVAPTQLFLILQEAVANAIKHGKASAVDISVSDHKGITTLTVKDNGIGMKNGSHSPGIGLQTMAYRARAIGGFLQTLPGASGGTVVTCTFNSRQNDDAELR